MALWVLVAGLAASSPSVALDPGSYFRVEGLAMGLQARRTCVHVGDQPVTVRVGTLDLPVEGGDLSCGPGEERAAPSGTFVCRDPAAQALVVVCGPVAPFSDQAARAPTGPPAGEPLQLFVLDVEADDDEKNLAGLVTALVTTALAETPAVEVLSGHDVRRVLDVEAERSLLTCDTGACLAEVADAVGARYLVRGRVTTAGPFVDLQVSLVDTHDARSRGFQQIRGRGVEDLAARLRPSLHNLLAEVRAVEPVAAPPPPLGRTMTDALTLGGAVGAGLAAGLGTGVLMAVPGAVGAAAISSSVVLGVIPAVPRTDDLLVRSMTYLVLCGPAVSCGLSVAGAAGIAALVDLFSGFGVSLRRVLWVTLAGLTGTLTAMALSGGLVLLGASALLSAGVLEVRDDGVVALVTQTGIALAGALLVSATLVTGLAVAGGYLVGVGLWGDAPREGAEDPEGAKGEVGEVGVPTSSPTALLF